MTDSRRPGSRSFDLLMVALLAVLVVGGHILVWADDPDRGLVSGNQLFSIWALPVYIGFLPAAYVLFLWWSGRRRGGGLPLGYRAALLGAALFLLALIAEFAWRAAGARPAPGPEGVLAPSRIALFVGAALMLNGPLLSLWRRLTADGDPPRRIKSIDAGAFAVALGLLLSLTTLLTGFVHPFVVRAGAPVDQQLAETPTSLYRVPVNIISVLAAGIAADVVFIRDASTTRRLALNMAGTTAFVLVLSYFLLLTSGVSWGLDLVLGAVILSSVLAMGLALILAWDQSGGSAEPVGSDARVS